MRERPILFSAPMIRALLAGTKTQTRRVVKPQPIVSDVCGAPMWTFARERAQSRLIWPNAREQVLALCPYGQPGDRLYVRETWRASSAHNSLAPRDIPVGDGVEYAADPERILTGKTRTAIHMPRWASRITLEVTGVRVERLNDISEADAREEGCLPVVHGDGAVDCGTRKTAFRALWESINGTDSWAANPWVWVVEFRRCEQ